MPPDTPSPFRTMSHPFTSISSSDSHRHLTCSLLSLANASSTGSVEPQFFWRWNSCIWLWFQYVKLDLSFKAYALLRASKSASGTSKVHCTESRWFHQPNLSFNPLPEASSHPSKYVASCSRTHTSVITIVFTFLLSNHTFTNTRLLIFAALLSIIL